MAMDDHGPTLENCSTLCSVAASEASASKDDPESINAGAPNLSDRWLTSDHLHNGPALFE